RAADAVVVAEPEPAEYVRICDVYGTGYFYIPGTETCLRVGGYVRLDVSGGEAGSFTGRRTFDSMDGHARRSYGVQSRFALRTWTGQETELGTLKTFTETRINYTNGATDVDSHFMWIQLGGLRLGVDESAFDTFQGYAGNVINDTLVPYGGFGTNLISYTFDAGNGFSALVSLEQGNSVAGGGSAASYVIDGTGAIVLDTPAAPGVTSFDGPIDSYMPNVVGGLKYTAGWGGISGVAAYDSNYEEWAGKVRLDVNATEQLSLFIMGGYGSDDNIARNFYKPWGGNWAVWGGGTYKINEKTSLNAQISYDEAKSLGVAANVSYDIVPGFNVTAELDYVNQSIANQAKYGSWTGIAAGESDAIGGIVRFQRTF
ncbi:MAG: porin, partial [Mesorhizobium sp.]